MNLLLGLLLLVLSNGINPNLSVLPTMEVASLQEGMGAQSAGILPGDTITVIDGNRIYTHLDLNMALQGKDTVSVAVNRDGEKLSFQVPLTVRDGYPYLGIVRSTQEKNFWNVFSYSYHEAFSIVKLTYQSFFGMFTGSVSMDQMAGPVGIVTEIGSAVKSGIF